MPGRPELHVEVDWEYPLEQSLQGVFSYPVLIDIDVRWHFGDSKRALELLELAYLDARGQIEITLKDNADANEGDPQ